MILYKHQLLEQALEIRKHRSHHKKKNGSNATTFYCDDIFTFDIEVTSAWLEKGNVIGYKKGLDSEYWNSLQPLALPYIWQFSVNDVVYYGREFTDFINVLDDLKKRQCKIIIWVHNLSYEFHFLTNILKWETVFARTPHKPMKCISKDYPDIEFRCSYMLTRLSLEAWGNQLNLPKMVGDLDYELIRTPLTELTEKELGYCKRDCLVLYQGIKYYINKYGNQWNIPLTQTGTIRREVKNILMNDEEYVKFIKKLVPSSAEEYKRLQCLFAGGYTHANRKYSGMVLEEYIEHYDFASSYPTVMIAEKYPMTPWITSGTEIHEELFEDYAFILHMEFIEIEAKTFNTYLQYSKTLDCENSILDNGRIIKADKVEIIITEQDYITIKNNYNIKEEKVIESYKSYKDYLPKKLIEYILELYGNKTTLKDVIGKEDLYVQSKQYINALFGMCVTAIVQPNIIYNEDGTWTTEKMSEDVVNSKLSQLRGSNKREKRYFLSYSWGCWITAYARRNLWKCIESCDKDVIYCDTDSIFVLGEHDFSWYNEEITNKLRKSCEKLNIDFALTRPKTPKGKEKPLGIFDKEDDCIEFITLGAKRYVERRSDNKLYLTVSGINKNAVELLNNDIYNFKEDFNFDKDADCVTKKLCTYIKNMPVVQWEDGYISTFKEGINLRRNGYKLTINDEYNKLIEFMTSTINDIPEENLIKLKGFF